MICPTALKCVSSNTSCLDPDDSGYAVKFEDYCKLEAELAALKTEFREICAAIDDPACDLTLTAVECIKKLKAENESLKLDAERYRWLKNNDSPIGIYSNADFDGCYYIHESDEVIDTAMAQGEQE